MLETLKKLLATSYLLSFGLTVFLIAIAEQAGAGGGMVIEEDKYIVEIEFYSAHFTAYQLDKSGNQQYCEQVPGPGETLFVLDYLHRSLQEVPVSFRIIRDATGQGRFVKPKHIQALGSLESYTEFYQAPIVEADGSFQVRHQFTVPGEYLVIVTAGHPTSDKSYLAVFPFEVRGPSYLSWLLVVLLPVIALLVVMAVKGRLRLVLPLHKTGAAS